jgi:hypothetical protein
MSLRRPPFLEPKQRALFDALGRGELGLADHADLLPIAIDHGIAAHCAFVARQSGQVVPELWRSRLHQVAGQNLLVRSQLDELAGRLNAAGVPWLAGKGWLRQLDPVLGERLMGDIDLYVPQAAHGALGAALEGAYVAGLQGGEAYNNARVFRPVGSGVDVDVHYAVHGALAAADAPVEPLVERAERRGEVPCPCPADDYIITLIDALCGAWNNPLRRLWELAILRERLNPNERAEALAVAGLKADAERAVEAAFASRKFQRSYRRALVVTLCRASRHPVRRLIALAALRLGART